MNNAHATHIDATLSAASNAGRSAWEVLRRAGFRFVWFLAAALLPCAVHAAQTTVNFAGNVDFIVESEYGTAQPIPPGAVSLLPLFAGATRIQGSYSYDASVATDLNPDPSAGQYVTPGSFSLSLPDIGLVINSVGPSLGLSVYPGVGGEFHVNGNAGLPITGNLGGATPFAISFVFYAPVGNDSLPLGQVPWTFGNAHIALDNVTPARDIFLGVSPVPEPSVALSMAMGLMLLGFVKRVARNRRSEI